MFRETDVKGLRIGGEEGKGRNDGDGEDGEDGGDWGGGSASNVRIEGVACSSTRLGNRLGELKGVGGCWKLMELTDGGVPQIVLRWGTVTAFLTGVMTSSRFVNFNETIFV